jgi:hypothetical protein
MKRRKSGKRNRLFRGVPYLNFASNSSVMIVKLLMKETFLSVQVLRSSVRAPEGGGTGCSKRLAGRARLEGWQDREPPSDQGPSLKAISVAWS